MSDQIIGVSVLQPTRVDWVYRLWFLARKGTGELAQGNIFMKDRRHPGLPDKMPNWPAESNTIWTFVDRGPRIGEGWLDCQPSVNWISWGFHNDFHWSTAFVEMNHRSTETGGLAASGARVHSDLNLPNQTDDYRHILIQELRAKGVLR